jgi:hypothetical protein
MEKVCTKCNLSKELTVQEYHTCKRAKDGFRSECIECRTGKKRERFYTGETVLVNKQNSRARRITTIRGYLNDALANSLRSRHKDRHEGVSDLTIEHLLSLWETQCGKCYWTGIELTYGPDIPRAHLAKLSFDRLDNTIGYMQGNVVLASNFANRGRGNASAEEFKTFLTVTFPA